MIPCYSISASAENAQEAEGELRVLVNSLKKEIENKNHDLQVMQKSLERLRKEKQISFTTQTGLLLYCSLLHF